MNNINVPDEIVQIEEIGIKEEKVRVVRSQRYEEAARLQDTERTLNDKQKGKLQWEEDSKNKRVTVTVDHVGDVVGMMTGIPVQRIAEGRDASPA